MHASENNFFSSPQQRKIFLQLLITPEELK